MPARWLLVYLCVSVVVLSACAPPSVPRVPDGIAGLDALPGLPTGGPSWAPAPIEEVGLRTLARADATGFTLRTAHGPVRFLAGVNLGSTVPGHQPGELAITAAHYRRWLPAMARMGVRVVRVYTIHPPTFYQELARYNTKHRDAPIYLIQGVYLPNESYVDTHDLYDAATTDPFRAELRDAVAAVHGTLRRAPARGRAHGAWHVDVSTWLAGWVIGVEWDPDSIFDSDQRNAAAPPSTGRYFTATADASPTERWLAARMDELATAQAALGRSVPVAFANWPTTDPLRHPDEPLRQEDLVGVDANHVRPTAAWPGGTFASYHAYPYYPDFQRHEPALQRYAYRGRSDPFAGYLDALRRHHTGMPVLITEFGVPSAIGWAHTGPLGRDQGNHDEAGAMRTNAELVRLIRDVGMSGALLFAWTDEWFKFTWNTINHQVPADRRQLWHDALTNEQHFGVLATDPTGAVNAEQWALRAGGLTAQVRVDEGYLHVDVDLPAAPQGPVTVGLDVVPEITGASPPTGGDAGRPADAALVLDPTTRTGQAWIRSELDPLALDHAIPAGERPVPVDGWQRYQLITNRPLTVPTTAQRLPIELADVGVLRWGSWEPGDPQYNSRALWRLDGVRLRLRIPWAFAGMADPSSKRALVPSAPGRTVQSPGIGLSIGGVAVGRVDWQPWQRVGYRERLKPGAVDLRAALLDVGRPG